MQRAAGGGSATEGEPLGQPELLVFLWSLVHQPKGVCVWPTVLGRTIWASWLGKEGIGVGA